LRGLIRQAVGDNDGSMVVRVTIFDPDLDLGHPGNQSKPQVLLTTRSAVSGQLPPLTVSTIHYERDVPAVKHIGLFATMYHRRQAQLTGFDDVLFLDGRGLVSEGATWNIAFVQDDRIVWPDGQCLPGITMELIKQLHASSVAPVDPSNLTIWTGAFITNAAVGVRPVAAIDGHRWREPPALVRLLSEQYAATEGEMI
jgi:branched-subunit amino acid aminotransferase/4-amino-4-deoxychorismate lyase